MNPCGKTSCWLPYHWRVHNTLYFHNPYSLLSSFTYVLLFESLTLKEESCSKEDTRVSHWGIAVTTKWHTYLSRTAGGHFTVLGSEAKLNLRVSVLTKITVTNSPVSAQVRKESRLFVGPWIGVFSHFVLEASVFMWSWWHWVIHYSCTYSLPHWQLTLERLSEAISVEGLVKKKAFLWQVREGKAPWEMVECEQPVFLSEVQHSGVSWHSLYCF